MNGAKKWATFLRFWSNIYASDFETSGDLVEWVNKAIDKIKRGKG